jgi:hypothetical protein
MNNQNLRANILSALLLTIGLLLHTYVPPILAGMRPDLLLGMLFVVIMFFRGAKGPTAIAGVLAGVFSALTTTFPGGQIANLVDKAVTAVVVALIVRLLGKRLPKVVLSIVVGVIGTVVSGSVFLGTAFVIAGLPASFLSLIVAVVLPATALNVVSTSLLYGVVEAAARATHYEYNPIGARQNNN